MDYIEKRTSSYPTGIIKSRRWLRNRPQVNACPRCGALDPEIWRLLQPIGSTYLMMCTRCHFHPRMVFSFSPKRGLPRALRKWNKVKKSGTA